MTNKSKSHVAFSMIGCMAFMVGLAISLPLTGQEQVGEGNISDQQIAALEQSFDAMKAENPSRVTARRNLKKIVRQGQEMIDASPDAPNRFAVLGIMFECQKRLIALDNTQRNREVLFEISARLSQAPDRYAESRLEADLMLAEKELSQGNATLEERAKALEKLIERYRGTTAEAKSLLLGALIASKLNAPELEDSIYDALDENFSDDHEVIDFRRKYLSIGRLDLAFQGEFTRTDGATLRFPQDTMGHLCLFVFWSKDKPATDEYLKNVDKALAKTSEPIDVFSLNLDELPDAGRAILKQKELDWITLELPEGRNHQAYRTYAGGDPFSILVNEYGFTVIHPDIVHKGNFALDSQRISESRYMAQLQSLFIGDFLISGTDGKATDSAETLRSIENCFVPPPFRYRLPREQALENYRKADKLCDDAMEQLTNDAHRRQLHDHRIIALLGIWNLAFEPAAFEKAVEISKAALSEDLPAEARVIPQFCLAKAELRAGKADAGSVIAQFIENAGGQEASGRALAAACILALDARSRELHEKYCARFLQAHQDDPRFYAFTSFLRDRHHQYRLLKANHNRRERSSRGYIINHGGELMREPFPRITLKKLDGSDLVLPRKSSDKMTILLFVEPPADGQSDFPADLDGRGNPTKNDPIRKLTDFAQTLSDEHLNQGVEVVTAFLNDDASRVEALIQSNQWKSLPVMVPGGLNNPMVRQLGILSADKVPNVFLLRRDGTIAWWSSGLSYKSEFGFPYAYMLAMKVHIELNEVERGYEALKDGNFDQAAQIFTGPFRPFSPDRFGWRSPRYHGQAIAQMKRERFAEALDAIDVAIDAHKFRHYRGRGPRNKADWREVVADFTVKEPCNVLAMLWTTRAEILDKLGRNDEAGQMRTQARMAVHEDRPNIYGAFHQKLRGLNGKPQIQQQTP